MTFRKGNTPWNKGMNMPLKYRKINRESHFLKQCKNMPPINLNLSKIQLAYIAGFVDGEGSIFIDSIYDKVRFRIGNTDKEVIEIIHAWLDLKTKIRVDDCERHPRWKPSWKTMYTLAIDNQYHIYQLLKKISPFLIIKKEKAIEAIKNIEKKYGELLRN